MKFFKFFVSAILIVLFVSSCKDHTVKIKADPKALAAGERGAITIKLKAHGKWHFTEDTVVIIKVNAPPGLKFDKEELKDAGLYFDKEPTDKYIDDVNTYIAKYTVDPGAKKGEATIGFDMMFSICSEDLCRRIMEKHEAKVTIE